MKKLLYLTACVILGLSSCKKNDTIIDDGQSKETFVWEGETFDAEEVKTKLSLIMGVDKNQLIFVPDSLAFQWNRPTSHNLILLYIKDYIGAIKIVE